MSGKNEADVSSSHVTKIVHFLVIMSLFKSKIVIILTLKYDFFKNEFCISLMKHMQLMKDETNDISKIITIDPELGEEPSPHKNERNKMWN